MQFAQYRPTGELANFVKAIWIARGAQAEFSQPDPIVPDGCVELVFNLAAPFVGPDGRQQPCDLLAGQMTHPVTALPTGDVDLIGVRLWPGRAGAAFRVPMWQLQEQLVAASDVMRGIDGVVSRLQELHADARVDGLARELSARFGCVDRARMRDLDQAVEMIHAGQGRLPIQSIASRIGITRRHLERRFLDEVGLTMKDLSRIVRMHAALRLIESPRGLSGAVIAAECGYSDQAHLIRECRALTGQTPARFVNSDASLGGLLRDAAPA